MNKFFHHDFSIINYEGTFTEPGNGLNPSYNFRADKDKANLLKQAGVTHVSVANNHSFDFGVVGYDNTISALTDNDIEVMGNSCYPVVLQKGKYQCAILSVSLTSNNGQFCLNTKEAIINQIADFSLDNPSIPLVLYIHWGLELQPVPEPWQVTFAEELIDLGVTAIIGHHPHVVQSVDFIDGKPVFYSIGNFVADAYLPETEKAIAVNLTFSDTLTNIAISPIELKRYFPRKPQYLQQFDLLLHFLSYSSGIGVYKGLGGWGLKPSDKINFREETDTWLFAENKNLFSFKRLSNGSVLMTLHLPFKRSNTIALYGEISGVQIADINNDGNIDVIVEVTKEVNFDPSPKKRLQIYTFRNGNLEPLWLGTKFIYDLESFRVIQENGTNYLTTLEKDDHGVRYKMKYEWDEFGFGLESLNKLNQ